MINLGGQQTKLRFNNNTFRILGQRSGKNLEETLQAFSTEQLQKDPLTGINDLIISALTNEKHYSGDTSAINENQLSAWIGDLDTNDLVKIMEAFSNSIVLMSQKPGNADTPAV